ncbi:TRAP transporter small permease [Limimaricola cinnabarinus]|uniref:TRAP transporter small permease n=1 Tax=Limimaricola cinnabarinus TaxID=1125964 RepID=UPI002492C6B2|nr:TRAP transporter small permease [Limimaricola cinnabarinus]
MRRYSFEGIVASALFILLFAVLMIQIFGRTPMFRGPVWTEEAARWIWVWMAFIAIAAVERNDAQLRMGFLADALPARARHWLAIAVDLLWGGILCHLVLISWKTVQRTWNNEAVTLPATDAVLYAAGLVAVVLVLHRVARRILARLRAGPDMQAPAGPGPEDAA